MEMSITMRFHDRTSKRGIGMPDEDRAPGTLGGSVMRHCDMKIGQQRRQKRKASGRPGGWLCGRRKRRCQYVDARRRKGDRGRQVKRYHRYLLRVGGQTPETSEGCSS